MALTQISTGGIKDDAVTDAKLPANSVGNSEMKDDAVGVAELSATGTASSSTFLRGDNSWVTPTDTNTQLAFANDGNNRVVTGDGSGGLNGEANLNFDGSDLTVTDTVSIKKDTYLSSSSTISSRLTLNSDNTSSWTGGRDLVALDLIGNGADHRTGTLSIKVKKGAADTDPTEMMRIDGVHNLTKIISGNLDLVDGDLKVADGHGIDFSAQTGTSATGATTTGNETLDHYENGTWTPTIIAPSGTVTSYSTQIGHYTRIGNMVYAQFAVKLSDKGDISGSYSYLGGLPFNNAGSRAGAGTVYYFANLASAVSSLHYELGGSSPTVAWLTGVTGTSGTITNYIAPSYYSDTTHFEGQLVYRIA